MASTTGINKEKISQFISSIASKYELEEEELITHWEQLKISITKKTAGKGKTTKKADVASEPVLDENIEGLTLVKLKELCRTRGLKISGLKAALVARLKGEEEPEVSKTSAGKGKAGKKKKVVSDKSAKQIEEKSTVLDKLKEKSTICEIRRNNFNNILHSESNLVFKKINGEPIVIGHEGENGVVLPLNKEDIQNCKKYKFNSIGLPENLDTKKDEEEEIIEDDEELEEEEEEINSEGSEEVLEDD